NIESLCADGESLVIGFRNPVPDGKALLVPLKNPAAVIDSGASPDARRPHSARCPRPRDPRHGSLARRVHYRRRRLQGPQSGGSATIEALPMEWQKRGCAGVARWRPRGFESGGCRSLWRGTGGKTTAFER